MPRIFKSYPIESITINQVLEWAKKYEQFLFLNGNNHETFHKPFPKILFTGIHTTIESHDKSLSKLEQLLCKNDWVYGYLSYDLKNEIEDLNSSNPATIPVPNLAFSIPETIINFKTDGLEINSYLDPDSIINDIKATPVPKSSVVELDVPISRTTKQGYFQNVNKIKNAIVEGEFYEMNYCIEYVAINTQVF